ncbi:MAG: xylose isomerase, partial [Vicinamibacterales bacterium]
MRIANAPCSWGVLELDWAGPAPSFDQVLDEMAMTGYAGTELGDWGFLPTAPDALRAELVLRGLALAGAFVPVRLTDAASHDEGAGAALR